MPTESNTLFVRRHVVQKHNTTLIIQFCTFTHQSCRTQLQFSDCIDKILALVILKCRWSLNYISPVLKAALQFSKSGNSVKMFLLNVCVFTFNCIKVYFDFETIDFSRPTLCEFWCCQFCQIKPKLATEQLGQSSGGMYFLLQHTYKHIFLFLTQQLCECHVVFSRSFLFVVFIVAKAHLGRQGSDLALNLSSKFTLWCKVKSLMCISAIRLLHKCWSRINR